MLHTNEKWIEALDPKNLNIIKNLYVSNLGRVKKKAHSITVKSGHPRHYKERISSGTLKSDGYVSAFGYSLHTLVFCSFSKEIVGPGYVVHHKNNKRADNCLNNLEKVTFSENALAKNRTGKPLSTAKKWRGRLPIKPKSGEIWMPIKDFPNYEVSDLGRIKNVSLNCLMRLTKTRNYEQVTLQNRGAKEKCSIHRLVWTVFKGPIPDKFIIHHKNDKKNDNRLENLDCITYAENTRLAHESGALKPYGKDRNNAEELALLLKTGLSIEEIKKRTSYSKGHILKIRRELGLSKTSYTDFKVKEKAMELLRKHIPYKIISDEIGLDMPFLRRLKYKMGLTKSRNIQQETFNSIEERLRKGPKRESMNEIAKMFKVSKPVVLELNKKLKIRTKKVGKRLLRT